MTTPTIDAFGFPEYASTFSAQLINAANQVSQATSKCAALLRSLNYQLLNGTGSERASLDDVQVLVELALEALPDPNGEMFGRFDDCELAWHKAFSAARTHQQGLLTLIDALEVAANLGSTLAELDEAANRAHDITKTLPGGQRHWDAFCGLIARRGLTVEHVQLADGRVNYMQVHTAESHKKARATRRKMAAFHAAAHDEANQRATWQDKA